MNKKRNKINNEINNFISRIRNYNPIELMYILKSREAAPKLSNEFPTAFIMQADNNQTNLLDYVTSIITSFDIADFKDNEPTEEDALEIMKMYNSITTHINQFFISYSLSDEFKNSFDSSESDYIFNRFIYSNINGKRYECFEDTMYKHLLKPHLKEINKLFNLTEKDFFNGFAELRKFSSGSGFFEGINMLKELVDELDEKGINSLTAKEHIDPELNKKLVKSFSVEQYEINPNEIWNESFLDSLSLSFGDNTSFKENTYAFWPINNSKIKYKPFIKCNGKYYCFNYFNLVDNFYRSVYKALINADKSYQQTWQSIQKDTTENLVGKLFLDINPNAKVLRDNYYYPTTKGNRTENDLIIIFDNTIFIIEVKAGSFTPDSPFINFSSHKDTIKNLIEKPDEQCMALINYLEHNKAIYDEKKNIKTKLDIKSFDNVYALSLTLENFNEVASIIEKFNNIKFNKNNFLLSIDDLFVYADYFRNKPYLFVDYFKYRFNAKSYTKFHVDDELNYLGLYISYRDFIEETKYMLKEQDEEDITDVYFEDAREELDSYYNMFNSPFDVTKPMLAWMDDYTHELINQIYKSTHNRKNHLISKLLEASYQCFLAKNNYFERFIRNANSKLIRVEDSLFISTLTVNETELNLIYPKVKLTNDLVNKAKLRTLAKLKINKLADVYLLFLTINKRNKITDIKIKYLTYEDVSRRNNQHKLDEIGKNLYFLRKSRLLEQLHLNVYPDDQFCPCGSGKMYIDCCKKRGW